MINRATVGVLLSIAINFLGGESATAREISPRLLKLAKSKDLICDEAPYCFKFKAIVDIDKGYLRVWTTDEDGNDYVVKRLYKGDTVFVRQVFTYKGIKRAQLSVMREDCMVVSCSGSVELQYLR